MIGKQKRIIVFKEKGKINVMFNPEIIAKSEKYTAQEGCRSLREDREARSDIRKSRSDGRRPISD